MHNNMNVDSHRQYTGFTRRTCIEMAGIGALSLWASGALHKQAAWGSSLFWSNAEKAVVTETRPSFVDPADFAAEKPVALVPPYTIAPGLANVINESEVYGNVKRQLLEILGFAVTLPEYGGGEEFFATYENNRYYYRPNFVTVDSMMHTYHLYFMYLMKNLERNVLSRELESVTMSMLDATQTQLEVLRGTAWENAAKTNFAFFNVGAYLLGLPYVVPAEVSDLVYAETSLIEAHAGMTNSPLKGSVEDYTQYIVRGYYEGDPTLESYFKAMMWYGRMGFSPMSEDATRAALLMTLALEEGSVATWEKIYQVTAFFAGASDDNGYYEYLPLAQKAYGEGVTLNDLVNNTGAWQTFMNDVAALKPSRMITFMLDEGEATEAVPEFRFMGQRFSFDAAIMQQLVANYVGPNAEGEYRQLPSALDVAAAMGSIVAKAVLDAANMTQFEGYEEHLARLQAKLEELDDSEWVSSLYSMWLRTIQPLLEAKGEGYPMFMQQEAWWRKSLLTYMGSYTELKHDTVLYAKQVMAEGDGGIPPAKDDRGYVEPEPVVFKRLAALSHATAAGLEGFGYLDDNDAYNLGLLEELATHFAEIATKELQNELPTEEEFEIIRSYGLQLEHFWQEVYKNEPGDYHTTRNFPAAVITDIATNAQTGNVLEIATGRVAEISVVVPVDGSLRVATGTVYTFYEFEQPGYDRLTDSAWRQMIGIAAGEDGRYNRDNPHDIAWWVRDFALYNSEMQ
ncbi:MAG: DUF3160 domain-containing protein [Coriobacteriales bacterium]|nr:DUF3160 domain-containing protein [Coriobacteriales bacterium]